MVRYNSANHEIVLQLGGNELVDAVLDGTV